MKPRKHKRTNVQISTQVKPTNKACAELIGKICNLSPGGACIETGQVDGEVGDKVAFSFSAQDPELSPVFGIGEIRWKIKNQNPGERWLVGVSFIQVDQKSVERIRGLIAKEEGEDG